MPDYFEIGYFQLENLLLNQVQFFFFDIRNNKVDVKDEPLRSMLHTAIPIDSKEVESFLKEKAEDKSAPIVVMCDSGEISVQLANELSELGYLNVNVIEQGFQGLMEDSQSMTHS